MKKTIFEKSLDLHEALGGKISTELKTDIVNANDLSLVYSPGVAEPCRKIAENKEDAFKYTWKKNVVAVVSDGTAVLGLGDIGPEASLPVMEGKSALFKRFAGVDSVPVVLDTKDTEEIIQIVKAIAPTYGGINLEDISAPRCVEIERRLKEELDIPVFHDDQHGTAIVVSAGLINSLKLVKKEFSDVTVVVSGTGAAGSSVIRMLLDLGVKSIYAFNKDGLLNKANKDNLNSLDQETAELTNLNEEELTMAEAMTKADVFIGVSAPNIVTKDMVESMKDNPIIFAMANPSPEIDYELAKEAGAAVVGTGRSDCPNQVNNVLAFPGLFKGALEVGAKQITEAMKMAAAKGLASLISDDELSNDYVIPSAFNEKVAEVVAAAVKDEAIKSGLARNK